MLDRVGLYRRRPAETYAIIQWWLEVSEFFPNPNISLIYSRHQNATGSCAGTFREGV